MLLRVALFLICTVSGFASGSTAVFAKYPNPCFIETGAFLGDGIHHAIRAGFEEIYSIELSEHYFQHCKHRYQKKGHVHLLLGDSAIILGELLDEIDCRCTFWLDGHYSGGNTAQGKSYTALMRELMSIKEHFIKDHTILIDDVRLFDTVEMDFISLSDVVEMIRSINPDYVFAFEDGYVKNDILVAYVP